MEAEARQVAHPVAIMTTKETTTMVVEVVMVATISHLVEAMAVVNHHPVTGETAMEEETAMEIEEVVIKATIITILLLMIVDGVLIIIGGIEMLIIIKHEVHLCIFIL